MADQAKSKAKRRAPVAPKPVFLVHKLTQDGDGNVVLSDDTYLERNAATVIGIMDKDKSIQVRQLMLPVAARRKSGESA